MVHIKWHYQYGPGNQKNARRETWNKELGDLNEHESWVSFPKLLLSHILCNTFKVLVDILYQFHILSSLLPLFLSHDLPELEPGPGEVVHHLNPRPDPVPRPAVDEAVQGGLHLPPPLLEQEQHRVLAETRGQQVFDGQYRRVPETEMIN